MQTTKKDEGVDKDWSSAVCSRLTESFTDMEIDEEAGVTAKPSTKRPNRIQKRVRHKARSTMVFPVYKKGKRVGPRTKPRK